jgi:hypothetical protein
VELRNRSEQTMTGVLDSLAAEYPQLYLNQDADTQETYRRVVLQGEEPEERDLGHYVGDQHDHMETADTPAGPVHVVTLGSRRDFELVLRGLIAAKNGPKATIPESQGAAMLTVFNWPRIWAHLAVFPEEEKAAEFKRFTSVKKNYLDALVVLSRGPYSGVPASALGLSGHEWLALSDTIRRYHELTHVICRRLYPDDIDPIRDELIVDAVVCTRPSDALTRRRKNCSSESGTGITSADGWRTTPMRRTSRPVRSAQSSIAWKQSLTRWQGRSLSP